MWWRFRSRKLAMVGGGVVLLFYVVVVFADVVAYSDPFDSNSNRSLVAPQPLYLFDQGTFRPHVNRLKGQRDMATFQRVYVADPRDRVPIVFFGHGFPYRLFGLIPMDRHLLAVEEAPAEETLFLLGTDLQGSDLWSTTVYAISV